MSEINDTEILRESIAAVPDFPKQGVTFRDISPLLSRPNLLQIAVKEMLRPWRGQFDSIAGIESRGFIFAAAASMNTGLGLHLVRKPGKLPPPVSSQSYSLEYGEDVLELKKENVVFGSRVLLVDDVLATGGTAKAAVDLMRNSGAKVVGAAFLIDLSFLPGKQNLTKHGVESTSVITY